jgi:transposase
MPGWLRNSLVVIGNQAMLMPLSLLDWVPEDHLVWTTVGAVDGMDLGAFYAAYRADGHGRPAYEPRMMG